MYHINITIFDEKNNTILCDVLASCTNLANVPRTLKTLLQTEPVLSVTNGSTHAPLTLPVDTTTTPQRKTKRAAAVLDKRNRMTNIARRTKTYVEPAPHMLDKPSTLRHHAELLGYLNTLPKDIPGIDAVRADAHRQWFSWYDQLISHGLLDEWTSKTMLTVRTWLAENLMARFAAHDFAGQQLRMESQRCRSNLLAGRLAPALFDAKMTTLRAKLAKLTGPVKP